MSPKSGKLDRSIKPPNSSKTAKATTPAKSMKSMSPANASTPTKSRKTTKPMKTTTPTTPTKASTPTNSTKSTKPSKPRKERDWSAAALKGVATKRTMRADKLAKEAQAAGLDSQDPPTKDGTSAANKRKRPASGSDDTEPDSNCSSFGEHGPKDVVGPQSRPSRLPPMHDMPVPRTPGSSQSRQPSSRNETSSPPGRFSPNVYKPLDKTTCPHVDMLKFRNEIPHNFTADEAGFDRHKHTFEMPDKRFADNYTVVRPCQEEQPRKARRRN